MKIKILSSTIADGRYVKAGNTEDVNDNDAMMLIKMGKAAAVDELPPVQPILTTENISGVVAEEKPRRGRPAKGSNAGK